MLPRDPPRSRTRSVPGGHAAHALHTRCSTLRTHSLAFCREVTRMPTPKLSVAADAAALTGAAAGCDAVVFVFAGALDAALEGTAFAAEARAAAAVDAAFAGSTPVLAAAGAAGGRAVLAHTGPLTRDYDDVRRVADAVTKGIKRAVAAGARHPLLVLHASIRAPGPAFAQATLVALVAAAAATYAHAGIRDALGEDVAEPVKAISVAAAAPSAAELAVLVERAAAIEVGRRVARDVGQGDPEYMAPLRCADYLARHFEGAAGVSLRVEADVGVIAREYPLAHAVAR
jgi:leucyl aminopeptidase